MRMPTGSARTISIMAVVAVLSLAAGLGLSRFIVSPSEAAANAAPPEAGSITVPVEMRALSNDVVMRGDAVYEDPVEVTVEVGELGGPAVVTGQVPEAGGELDGGDVLLEVTGRPVILLTGELPVYRTLRAGVSGPDVVQLKEALSALDIDAGSGQVYDAAAAAGVRALYDRIGYPAPTAGPDAEAALSAAREAVRAADEQVTAAQRELELAQVGVSRSERLRLQADVDTARSRHAMIKADCARAEPTYSCPVDQIEAKGALDVAIAARDEASSSADTSAQRAMLDSARRARAQAGEDLAEAQQGVITPLPAGEVVYLTETPRRVDAVHVRRGSTVGGPVMSVSGATLQIAGTVAKADADLIAEDAAVVIALPDGEEVPGTVVAVGADRDDQTTSDPSRTRVVVVPDDLTEDQRVDLQGANVRIRIPVSATDGEVLAVPVAALTAGPGGESRVEVLESDGTSRLVTVQTGLAAGGFVEITEADGPLEVGDRVVVGVAAAPGGATGSADDETEPDDDADADTADEDEAADEADDEG